MKENSQQHSECKHFEKLMIEYLDNTLSLDQKLDFEEHLKTCPGCQEFFETYRRTIELAHESAETCHFCHVIPHGVKEKIVSSLKALGSKKK